MNEQQWVKVEVPVPWASGPISVEAGGIGAVIVVTLALLTIAIIMLALTHSSRGTTPAVATHRRLDATASPISRQTAPPAAERGKSATPLPLGPPLPTALCPPSADCLP